MKNRILLLLLVLILFTSPLVSGLYVNSRNIMKERGVSFIEMIWEKENGNVTNINIKYGERENSLNREGILTEKSGRKMRFRTINEAVNHVKKNGWTDIRSFIHCFSGKAVYHFIFKK